MAHPHQAHRQHHVEHRRVHHITHGMAHGGYVHSDESEDMALIRKHVKKGALKAHGGKVKHRLDRPRRAAGGRVHKEQLGHDDLQPHEGAPDDKRSMHRARGGRAKHKGHTTVNVMVAPHQGPSPGGAAPMAPPAQAAVPPPPVPAMRPPMMPSPGGVPPGLPPGMPMRARGGKVTDGPAYQEGKRARPVDHAPGKMDGKDIGRKKVITYKTGGRVEAKQNVIHKYSHGDEPPFKSNPYKAAQPMTGGKGGLARIAKAHRAAKMR